MCARALRYVVHLLQNVFADRQDRRNQLVFICDCHGSDSALPALADAWAPTLCAKFPSRLGAAYIVGGCTEVRGLIGATVTALGLVGRGTTAELFLLAHKHDPLLLSLCGSRLEIDSLFQHSGPGMPLRTNKHGLLKRTAQLVRRVLGLRPSGRVTPHFVHKGVSAARYARDPHPPGTGAALPQQSWELLQGLLRDNESVIVADPSHPDCPLVYVSPGFEALTGYSGHEVLGCTCHFLQPWPCKATDRDMCGLRRAIKLENDVSVTLINRRKNGSLFYNNLNMFPLLDEASNKRFLVGVQYEVRTRLFERRSVAYPPVSSNAHAICPPSQLSSWPNSGLLAAASAAG
jgi:PAS domain S-box-containing protein